MRSGRPVRWCGFAAATGACMLIVSACGSDRDVAKGDGTTQPDAAAIRVVASTDVYGSVVAAVGGSRVAVTSLIDNANADPLEYEATPGDAVAVADAALVVFNGNGYDTFMPQLVDAAGSDAAVVDVAALSGLKPTADDGAFNEHVFYSLATMQTLADRIAEVLTTVSPGDAAQLTANARAFDAQIDGLHRQLSDVASAHRGARIAMTEPVPGYLIDEAGLDDVTPPGFSEAVEEGDDPSAAALADMLALFDGDAVDVLILNTQTQTAATDQIRHAAEDAGVPVVSMSETLTAPQYVTWMGGQIEALAEALDE